MNGYKLTRNWFDYKFENPSKVRAIHTDFYIYLVDQWNRLGKKEEFGLPTSYTMECLGIGSYNTYKKTLSDLVSFGFVKIVKDSKNHHTSKIIALSKYDEASDKASDKALDEATIKAIDKPTDTIIKQYKQYKHLNNKHINIILDYFDSLPYDVLNEKLKELNHVSDNEKIDFSVFWELYGKKKGNKLKVEKKWNKLSLSTQEKIIETLPNFKKSISDIQFLPFPETYLNNERWNDEIEETLQEEKTGYVRKYDWDSYLKTLEDE